MPVTLKKALADRLIIRFAVGEPKK